MSWPHRILLVVASLLVGPLLAAACTSVKLGQDWRTADRSPTGIAPDPASHPEAVVQVYAARAFNWRGLFAVHTWIATKRPGARHYVVHQVVGWRRWRGLPVVVSAEDAPDRSWFGQKPTVIADLRGPAAAAAIDAVEAAVRSYPYPDEYRLWPGPNSNTFTAWVTRHVPQLHADLPPTAIGKDYLPDGQVFGRAPSGGGVQLSLFGLLGVLAAPEEGLEVNVLGLSFGLDPLHLSLRLPGIGRVGPG